MPVEYYIWSVITSISMKKLIIRDEAHFRLYINMNKQNGRFWGMENSQIIHLPPTVHQL